MFYSKKHTLDNDLLVIVINDSSDEDKSYKAFHSKQNINRVGDIDVLKKEQMRKVDEVNIFT